jgi:hypothetical protein
VTSLPPRIGSEEDARFVRVYPAICSHFLPGDLIGMTGITDRHETESVIGMRRNS